MLLEDHFCSSSKAERGTYLAQYMQDNGISKPTFYRHQKNYLASNGMFTHKTDILRMSPERYARILQETFIFASIQKFYFDLGVEKTKQIMLRENRLVELADLSDSQIRRYLTKFGLSKRLRKQTRAAIQWKADYSNQIWMCDASPVEQYFMDFKKKKIVKRYDLESKDKHTESKIAKENLVKVWGYYIVDVYSRAYLVYYRAEAGESAAGWIAAFSYFFRHKTNQHIPVEGIMSEMLYTDMGSGLQSSRTQAFLKSLNPNLRFVVHPKKHPWAKGIVESRIGAWKKTEKMFHRDYFFDLEEFQSVAEDWIVYDQLIRTNKFRIWQEGFKDHPLKVISVKNLEDAKTARIKRKVEAHRCVNIGKVMYRIPVDIPQGVWIDVFFRESDPFAQLPDGRIVQLTEGAYGYDDPEAFELSDRLKRLNELEKQYKEIGKTIKPESIRPDLSGLESSPHLVDIPTESIDTHSPMPVDTYTLDEAIHYMVNETCLDETDWIEYFKENFEKILSQGVELTGEFLRSFTNSILTK